VAILILSLLFESPSKGIKFARLAFQTIRLCALLVLTGIAFLVLSPKREKQGTSEETRPLLSTNTAEASQNDTQADGYGTATAEQDPEGTPEGEKMEDGDDDDEDEKDIVSKYKGDWWSYAKTFAIFLPIVWPKGQRANQLRLFGCGLCLAGVRALNILRPRQYGILINSLTRAAAGEGSVTNAPPGVDNSWIIPIVLLTIYQLLGSSAGLPFIKSYLWAPVEYGMAEKLSSRAYNHIMNLSSDFHDSKRSGPLWYSIYNAHSVTDMLDLVFFDVLPVVFDFVLAAAYIYFAFDPYLALIVFGVSIVYMWSSAAVLGRQKAQRRQWIKVAKREQSILTETTCNWKTVSYFNKIRHEQVRYASAYNDVTVSHTLITLWYAIAAALKACIMELGLLMIMVIAGYQVVRGAPVGNIVTLTAFWAQITYPLAVIAQSFSRVMFALVDAEDLLKVLKTEPSIQDDKDAKPLDLKQGEVEFESVGFTYDKARDILNEISFRAEPGQTIALVGETGGGKSTILKLLFRFYDVTGGCIKIDGQDIRQVTLESLRRVIGNVPQDATLFNDTVMNNVRYAKIDATDEEVYEACKAAAIHEKVISFTKGYETKVGEGGTKLSGGELQRIAIARAILQDPQIVLLDEATSSVDTETEAHIQESLRKLTYGRTTFVIAHRLSTIVNADVILVIRKGEIVERGTHKKLMEISGQYRNLWEKQMIPKAERNRSRSRAGRQCSSDYLDDLGSGGANVEPKKSARDSGDADDGPVITTSSSPERKSRMDKERRGESQEPDQDSGKGEDEPAIAAKEETSTKQRKGKETDDKAKPGKGKDDGLTREASPEQSSKKKKETTADKERPAIGKLSGSRMKRFFRPDAPEFVPQTLREPTKKAPEGESDGKSPDHAAEDSSEPKDKEDCGPTRDTSSKGKQRMSYEGETSVSSLRRTDSRESKSHKRHRETFPRSPSYMASQATGSEVLENSMTSDSGQKGISTPEDGETSTTKKRRSNRRNQSKSEPGVHFQTDGTGDDDFTPEGSGEGQSVSQGHRRVSAPSEPPHQVGEAGNNGNLPRRRRRRQWRKKRNLYNSHSSSSAMTTGSSSMNSPDFNGPNAPPTSPNPGTTISGPLPKGNVKFADA
jgi:ABC-type transport system involved in Fe-S cluster assembly fused permease/ATPase subunit